ncbi:unnamed protein product [Xylocopa violacea]|uniref:Uncharacterized protein n=1 Tax=Xylocopa violacea TaxID=135666 RepID=A0ABP1N4C6_XYLVO
MGSSQRYSTEQSKDASISGKLFRDVHVMSHDLKKSEVLKNKNMIDSVRATYTILKDLKKPSGKVLDTVVDAKLTKLEVLKALLLAFLNVLSIQIHSLMDKIVNNDVTYILESSIFDFVTEAMMPLLSGSNNGKIWEKMMDTENIFSTNGHWLQKEMEQTVTDKGVPVEPVIKEPLLKSSKESSLRKVFKL